MTMSNTESRGPQPETPSKQGFPRAERGDAGTAREQIREVKDQVVDQAKSTFQQARERASSSLGESKGRVADQFGTMAGALRRTTEHLRAEDQQRIAGLTETVARQADQVANYLRTKDGRAMRHDVENLARRQPALVLGGALVLGLIAARFLKSSERRRGSQGIGDGRGYGGETETERHLVMGARSGGSYAGS